MIFAYSTFLLTILIVVVIALFLYRVIMSYAKSNARTKAKRKAASARLAPAGFQNYGTPRNRARGKAIAATQHLEDSTKPWGW